jgi:hypothetical protein
MATRLRFSRGTTKRVALSFVEAGSVLDLTGAAFEVFIKRSAFDADADALVDDIGGQVSVVDALAGSAILTFEPEDTEDLDPFQQLYWFVRATLSNGDIKILEAHQGEIVLTPIGTAADSDDDSAAGVIPSQFGSYVLNRYDLTGLTGGSAVKLDGLPAETLEQLANGAIVRLFFAGSIVADYRLRANGADAESAPWRIVCDNDTSRLWELILVTKEGVSCVWNPDTSKFHQLLAGGTGEAISSAPAPEASAFSLPA